MQIYLDVLFKSTKMFNQVSATVIFLLKTSDYFQTYIIPLTSSPDEIYQIFTETLIEIAKLYDSLTETHQLKSFTYGNSEII